MRSVRRGADNAEFHTTTATVTVAVCVWQWAWDLEPPAAAFSKKAEEPDLLADEAALQEDIVYPVQQPWLNRQ